MRNSRGGTRILLTSVTSVPQLPVTVLGPGRRRLDGSVTRMITPLCLADGPARAGMMLFQQRDVCP